MTVAEAADTPRAVKRRDLLIGSIALLGSAAVAGGGTAIALSSVVPPPPKPAPAATPETAAAQATPAHGAPAPASGHGAQPTAAAGSGAAPAADHAPAAATGSHWDYEGPTGPQAWGDLEPASAVCKQGGAQSPIDLADGLRVPALPGLQINYGATKVKVTNNGHTFQVNVDKGSSLTIDGKKFDLLQFHFHTPSEHTLERRAYPLELHLVHQAADKNLAVIGVLMAEGAPNMLLTKFWERLPRSSGEVDTGQTIDLKELLPRNIDDYLTYSGSLTTPPCTESVRWIVLRRSVEVSKAQIAAFRTVFPMNARPTQPVGARLVLSS
jgi:carbonic anhydrase